MIVFALPFVICGLISAILAVTVWAWRGRTGSTWMALLFAVFALVNILYLIELSVDSLPGKVIWSNLRATLLVFVPLIWLLFCMQYNVATHWIYNRIIMAFVILPIVIVALVWSNDNHQFLWSDPSLTHMIFASYLRLEYNPGLWVALIYGYGFGVAGWVIAMRKYFRDARVSLFQPFAITATLLLVSIVNLSYLFRWLPAISDIDFTPLALAFSGVLLFAAMIIPAEENVLLPVQKRIFDLYDDAVFVFDRQDTLVQLNPAAMTLLQETNQNLSRRGVDEVFRFSNELLVLYRQGPEESWRRVSQDKELNSQHYDVRITRMSAVRDKFDGKAVILRDVSRHSLIEESLSSLDRKYKALLSNTGDGIILLDAEGRIACWNRAMETLTGLNTLEAEGKPVEFILDRIDFRGDNYENFKTALRRRINANILDDQQEESYLFRIESPGAKSKTLEARLFRYSTTGETWKGISFRDVSETQALKDISRSFQERYELLLAGISGPIVAIDRRFIVQYCNQAFEILAGESVRTTKCVDLLEIYPEFKGSQEYIAFLKCLENSTYQEAEGWLGDRYFQTRIFPVPTGLLAVFEDLTDQIKIENMLTRYIDRLEGLRQIDQAILAAQTANTISDVALEHVSHLLGCDYACVMVLNFDEGEAQILAVEGYASEISQHARIPVDMESVGLDIRRGKITVIDDLKSREQLPELLNTFYREDMQAFVNIPLIAHGELIGLLVLGSKNNTVFSSEQLEAAADIADSLAIGVHNSKLFSETVKNLASEAKLNQVARVIGSTLDLETTLKDIVRLAAELVGAEAGALGLISESGDSLNARYLFNLPDSIGRVQERGEGLAWRVIETGSAISVSDYSEHPRAIASWIDASVHGYMGVPVEAGEVCLGVLSLYTFSKNKRFTHRELSLAKSVGRQAGIAIQNAQYYRMAQDQAKEAETLRQAGAVVTASLNLDETISRIFHELGKVIQHDSGTVQIFQDGEIEIIGLHGWHDHDQLKGKRFKLPEEVANTTVIREQKAVIFSQTEENMVIPYSDRIHSWLGVPLIFQDMIRGVLTLESSEYEHFKASHARLARTFVDQVVIAIENARLFEEVQRLAIIDSLTGFYSRRYFFDLAHREFDRSKRYDRPMAMMFLDLDRFRVINYTHGYSAGDQVLKQISDICRNELRSVDLIGRYGGEEFVVLLPECDSDTAIETAERLRKRMHQMPVPTEAGSVFLTFSIGVANVDEKCRSLDDLIERADRALNYAKNLGRDQVQSWSEDLEKEP